VFDPDCGATCVLLAKAIISLKIAIPPDIATAIAYGILSDTLNLYRAKTEDVFKTYLKILSFAICKP